MLSTKIDLLNEKAETYLNFDNCCLDTGLIINKLRYVTKSSTYSKNLHNSNGRGGETWDERVSMRVRVRTKSLLNSSVRLSVRLKNRERLIRFLLNLILNSFTKFYRYIPIFFKSDINNGQFT